MLASAIQPYYTVSANTSSPSSKDLIIIAAFLILAVFLIACAWKIFNKAGQAGWKAIIPIYSTVIMCRIVGLSGWFTILVLLPYVGVFFGVYLLYRLAKSFGYGIGMTVLEIFVIGTVILAFGKAKYIGPSNGNKDEDDHESTMDSPAPAV